MGMKFKFDIDCTPEEARRFLGLPDVTPMQDRLMEEMEERLAENIRSMDPETFMKSWFPAGMQGLQEMQKMFWSQMGVQMPGANTSDEDEKKKA